MQKKSDDIKEIGLYIHIPFCRAKCRYCDFNSFPHMEEHIPGYINALKRELSKFAEHSGRLAVKSIFIGGGTPSLLQGEEMAALLEHAGQCAQIKKDAEVSMESNPGTLNKEKLMKYKAAGVNRLSIGLQAWQSTLLAKLGRIHTADEFTDSYKAARTAGFNNINIDLIFGIPGQTMKDWTETLERVTELRPEHLSCYSLSIEEGTAFGDMYVKGELAPVPEELDREMYHATVEYLSERGYKHYEISNFAKEGCSCKHNLIYWRAEEYLGVGAGAHSYLQGIRMENIRTVSGYMETVNNDLSPVTDKQTVDGRESMKEYMILGLRLTEGIDADSFHARFGSRPDDIYGRQIERLILKGLLQRRDNRIFLTPKGLDLANSVFIEFLD